MRALNVCFTRVSHNEAIQTRRVSAMQALQILLLLVFPALAIVGALKDLTSYTIPTGFRWR